MTKPSSAAATQPLTTDERAELERLRAQVAAQAATPPGNGGHPGRGRWAGSIVLMLVAALLAPLSALATWSNATLLDTDEYVAMVAPLAEDPAVQEEISRRITDAVFEALDVQGRTEAALAAIAERPRVEGATENLPIDITSFAVPISDAVRGFTSDQVERLVASDGFEDAWAAANREAHAALVAALTGDTREGVSIEDGRVTVDLAAFITAIKPVLIERGVPFADRIPAVNAEFVVLESENLGTAQAAVRMLDLLHTVLPITAVLLLVAGVALAPSRRRALLIGASMVVGTLVLLLLGVQVLRALYLGEIEQSLLVPAAGEVLFDAVSMPLRLWVRASAVLFLLIAVAAWLAGPSSAARAVRTVPARIAGSTRRPTGALAAVSRFAAHNITGLRAGVAGLAVLAILVGDRPSAGDVLLIAVLVALALTLIEVFRRWGNEVPAQVGGTSSGAVTASEVVTSEVVTSPEVATTAEVPVGQPTEPQPTKG